jgi:hypothetical protein
MPATSDKSNIVRTQKSDTDSKFDGSFASKSSHLLDGKAWLDAFEVVGAEQNANSASRSAEFCGIGWRMYLPKFVAVELLLTSRGNGEFVASAQVKEFYFNSSIEAENLTTSYNSLALAVEQKLLPSYTLPNSVYVILELQLTLKSMKALFRSRCDSFSHETNSIVDAMITTAKQYFPSALDNINPLTMRTTNTAVNHSDAVLPSEIAVVDPEIGLPFEEDEPEHDSTELEPVVEEAVSSLPEPEPEHEVEPELEPEPEHDLNIEITKDLSSKVDAVSEIIIETKTVETPKEEAPIQHENNHDNIAILNSPVGDVVRHDDPMPPVTPTITVDSEKESAAQSSTSSDEEKSSPDSGRIVTTSVSSRKQAELLAVRSRIITSPVRSRREPEIRSREEPSESETPLRKEKEEPTIKRQNIVSPVRLKREPEQSTVRSRKDEEPTIKSRKNEEPEVRSRKNQEPEVRSRKDEEPEVRSRKNQEPEVRSRKDEEPEVRSRKDEEPEVKSRKNQEPEVRSRKDEEPEIRRQNVISPVRSRKNEEQPIRRQNVTSPVRSRKNEEPEVRSRKDEEPAIKSRKNEEPEVRSRKDEESTIKSRKDEEPTIKSRKREESEVRARKNEEPEVKSRKDEEPTIKSRKREESEVRARKNEEPEVKSRKDEEQPIRRQNVTSPVRSRKDEEPSVRSRKDEEPSVRSRKDEEPSVRSRKDEEPAVRSRKDEEPISSKSRAIISPIRSKREPDDSETQSAKPINDNSTPQIRSRVIASPVRSRQRADVEPPRRVVMSPVRNISTKDKDSSQEKDDTANLKYKSSADSERDLDDANYRPKDKNRAAEAAPPIRTVKLAVSPIRKVAASDDEAKAEESAPKVKRLTIVKNVKDETETRQPSPRRKVVPSPIKVFVVTGDGETANLVTKAKAVSGKRTIRVSAASPTRVLPGTRNPSV